MNQEIECNLEDNGWLKPRVRQGSAWVWTHALQLITHQHQDNTTTYWAPLTKSCSKRILKAQSTQKIIEFYLIWLSHCSMGPVLSFFVCAHHGPRNPFEYLAAGLHPFWLIGMRQVWSAAPSNTGGTAKPAPTVMDARVANCTFSSRSSCIS
jgi:hypothetical protein